MKRIAAVVLLAVALPAAAQVQHRGYVTRNGTYVAPHMQSAPDGNRFNNYSTQGNINPYTGQAGTVNPYRAPSVPSYSAPSYPSYPSVPSYGYQPAPMPTYGTQPLPGLAPLPGLND